MICNCFVWSRKKQRKGWHFCTRVSEANPMCQHKGTSLCLLNPAITQLSFVYQVSPLTFPIYQFYKIHAGCNNFTLILKRP